MSAEQLLVRIDATTEQLRREVRRAENTVDSGSRKINQSLGRIDRSFKRAGQAASQMRGAVVGTIAAFGGAQLARGIQTTVEGLERTKRQSDALKISFEDLQELQFAFRSFNLQDQDVPDVLQTINDRANDAANGMKSFQEDFALVNLEVEDLRGKNPRQLLMAFADAVASTKDRGDALAATTRILGDEYARELFPLLRQGSGRFDELGDKIRDAGGIMSEEFGEGASDAAQQLRIMQETMNAQFTRTIVENADEIEDLGRALAQAAEWAGDAVDGIGRLGRTLAAQQTGDYTQSRDVLEGRIANLRSQIGSRAAQGREEELRAELNELLDARERIIQEELRKRARSDIDTNAAVFGSFEVAGGGGSGGGDAGGDSGGSDSGGRDPGSDAVVLPSMTRMGRRTGSRFEALIEIQEDAQRATEETNREFEESRRLLAEIDRQAERTGEEVSEFAKQAKRNIQNELGDTLRSTLKGDFDQIGDDWENLIFRMTTEAAAAEIGNYLFGKGEGFSGGVIGDAIAALGSGGGSTANGTGSSPAAASGGGSEYGWVASVFSAISGAFAEGGRPQPGYPAIVGEKGPELFVPDRPGTVVPNDQMQGMGQQQPPHVEVRPIIALNNDDIVNAMNSPQGQTAVIRAVQENPDKVPR